MACSCKIIRIVKEIAEECIANEKVEIDWTRALACIKNEVEEIIIDTDIKVALCSFNPENRTVKLVIVNNGRKNIMTLLIIISKDGKTILCDTSFAPLMPKED